MDLMICLTVIEKSRLDMLRNNQQQQRKDEGPETKTPATGADPPVAAEASPAEPLAPPTVSTGLGSLKEAAKAFAGDGTGVVEPSEIASETQKITQAVSEVTLFHGPHIIRFLA